MKTTKPKIKPTFAGQMPFENNDKPTEEDVIASRVADRAVMAKDLGLAWVNGKGWTEPLSGRLSKVTKPKASLRDLPKGNPPKKKGALQP